MCPVTLSGLSMVSCSWGISLVVYDAALSRQRSRVQIPYTPSHMQKMQPDRTLKNGVMPRFCKTPWELGSR